MKKREYRSMRNILIDILYNVYTNKRFQKKWFSPPIESRDMGWLYDEAIILLEKERNGYKKELSKLKDNK